MSVRIDALRRPSQSRQLCDSSVAVEFDSQLSQNAVVRSSLFTAFQYPRTGFICAFVLLWLRVFLAVHGNRPGVSFPKSKLMAGTGHPLHIRAAAVRERAHVGNTASFGVLWPITYCGHPCVSCV